MKEFGLLMVICFGMWSCSNKKEEVPKNLLPEKQMVGILVNLHLAESKLNDVKGDIEGRIILFNAHANNIYEEHGTDSLQYVSSHDYYMKHLDLMKEIYQTVSDSLKVLRDSASNAKPLIKKPKNQAKAGS